jgi:AraC-like DNA-binding protein
MEELFQSTQMKSPHSQKAIRLLSELALLYLEWELDTSSDDQGHMITNRLAQLFEKVRAQLQLSWTVEALQEASGLYYSTDHFSRICSQYLGMTPMQKVIQLRMERSQELLLNTKFTLQIISGLVGYQDSFSFSAAFKRWSGLSPREFRKRSDGAS